MSLSPQFLDELRARTTLSALIGKSVKLKKAGRELAACCPFHKEKTASFTVSDEKGFAHCFGCAWHGDAIRWLTDHDALPFMDAVRQLADAAGMEVPARSAEAAAREQRIGGVRPALEAAQALFARELEAAGAAREYLAGRGIGAAAIERFGLGWAPARHGWINSLGVDFATALAAGLVWEAAEDGARRWGEMFRGRITFPVHDHRGRLIGFSGRAPQPSETVPKYKNSPDSEIFDKGAILFNLHRAAAPARASRRLIVVEGQIDAIALDQIGIAEAVAPMGTALTTGAAETLGGQLERLWRIVDRPLLAFDGDRAGRRAAVRACTAALPHVGPGRSLSVALFPAGQDPDDVARAFDPACPGTREEQGRRAIEAALSEAVPIGRLLFDVVAEEKGDAEDPEAVAGVWERLDALARTIRDEETRAQYLAAWRARYEREVSLSAPSEAPALHALIAADGNDERKPEDRYFYPEEASESERRLIVIVQRGLELRRQRREIGEALRDLMAMAKAVGFSVKAINAAMRDLEAVSCDREEHEALWALYRRVLGIRGPISEAILPSAVDPRARRVTNAAERRLSKAMVMIEARGISPAAAGASDHG